MTEQEQLHERIISLLRKTHTDLLINEHLDCSDILYFFFRGFMASANVFLDHTEFDQKAIDSVRDLLCTIDTEVETYISEQKK